LKKSARSDVLLSVGRASLGAPAVLGRGEMASCGMVDIRLPLGTLLGAGD